MMEVEEVLVEKYQIMTFMVKAAPGKDFAELTQLGLDGMAAMVAFCSSNYGERTGSGYETFEELKYAHQKQIPIIPVKLCFDYPPQPQKVARCPICPWCTHWFPPERDDAGCAQNNFVLRQSLVYIDGLTEEGFYISPNDLARKIYESLRENGLIPKVTHSWDLPKNVFTKDHLGTSCTIS
eukprot:Skav205254  [mRNA]  locus=scaffold1841:20192:20734:- [translate_table: standard]